MPAILRNVLRLGTILLLIVFKVPVAWALTATPTGLSFTAVQGTNPSSQVVNVMKDNRHQATWKTSNYAPWVVLSPGSGSLTNSTQIQVSIQASKLAVGTYTTTIKVTASKGGNVSIPVTLTVSSGTTSSSPSTTTSNTTATLTWDANTETDLAGYKIHVGTASGSYSSTVDVRNVTSYTLSNLSIGTTYHFGVSAYNTTGAESAVSSEVSKSIY